MRVLQTITTLNLGGAETMLCELGPSLRQLGVNVDIMCLSTPEGLLEPELAQKGLTASHTTAASPYSPFQILGLKKRLSEVKYHLIHSHLFPAQLWTAVGSQFAQVNVPLVTTEHSTWNRRRRKYFKPLDRWMYSRYAAIACIGATTESALQDWLPERRLPTKVVPNGINLERFAHMLRDRDNVRSGKAVTTLICVASLNPRKGQEVLLRAASLLPETEVVLVGEGPGRADLERLTHELGIVQRVRFLGNRRDVPELLAASDIYIQPSQWEGFGIAAVEAMAVGLPVVASNVPGLRDVVSEAGLLFEPGSVTGLRDCIAGLIRNPELQSRLSSLAKSRAQQFSIAHTAVEYLKLYESVLSR
jgi:glycosyltransferase involved in cell wall biosynthesis